MKSKRMLQRAVFASLVALCGCVPGEAGFTMKTSEVRKALMGEVVQIRVHEQVTTVLSNAYDRVSFGGYTNKLQVVKALVADVDREPVYHLQDGEWTNDTVKVWVEEKAGALPSVKAEGTLCVALGPEEAIRKKAVERQIKEVCVLKIDPNTGAIGHLQQFRIGKEFHNQRLETLVSATASRGQLLDTLFGKEEHDLASVDESLMWMVLPTWFRHLSCTVVGDSDEPLYIIAEDVTVNGKPMARFEGAVKKGETLCFELDKLKHKEDGGMRFFLSRPSAM